MNEKTRKTYNQLAQTYDEATVDFWNQFPKTFLDAFAQISGKNIISIGSGPGRDALLLQNLGKSITCLDNSESMMKICRSRGLKTILADFCNIPQNDASFDGVWAYTSLLHIPKSDIDIALNETARILVPNGVCAIGMIEGEGEGFKGNTGGIERPRWFSYYQKNELINVVTKHNFTLVHFETFKPASKNYLNMIFQKT